MSATQSELSRERRSGVRLVPVSCRWSPGQTSYRLCSYVRQTSHSLPCPVRKQLYFPQLLTRRPCRQLRSLGLTAGYRKQGRISASATPAPPSNRQVNSRRFLPGRRNVDLDTDPGAALDYTTKKNGPANSNSTPTELDVGKEVSSVNNGKRTKRAALRQSRQQKDDCAACSGRGFQIVDEVKSLSIAMR